MERMDPMDRVKSVLKLLDIPPTHHDFSQQINVEKESTTCSNDSNPFSFSGYLSRICTYKPQQWASAPKAAVCLAKHGFISIQDNKIQCCGCNEVVDVSHLWGKREFERVSTKCHQDICKWNFLSTPEEFFQLPANNNCIENYKQICNGLMSIGKKLPVIEPSKLKPDFNIPQDFVKSVVELYDITFCEIAVSAIVMGLCGWEKGSNNTFQCTFCKRTCATWNFFSMEDNEWRIESNTASFCGDNSDSNKSGNNILELHIESKIKDDEPNRVNGNGVNSILNVHSSDQEGGVNPKSRNMSYDSKDDEQCANFESDTQVTDTPSSRYSSLTDLPNGRGNKTNRNDTVPSPALVIMKTSNTASIMAPISVESHNKLDDKSDCFFGGNLNKVRINKHVTPFDDFIKIRSVGKENVELSGHEVTEERMEVLDNKSSNLCLPSYDDGSQNCCIASEIIKPCDNIYIDNRSEFHGNALTFQPLYSPSTGSVEGSSVYWVNNKASNELIDGQESHDSESPVKESIEVFSDETSTCKDDNGSLDQGSYFSVSGGSESFLKPQFQGKYCIYSPYWNAGKSKKKATQFIQSRISAFEMKNNYNIFDENEHNVIHVSEEEEVSYDYYDGVDTSDRLINCKHLDQKYVITHGRNEDTTKLTGQQLTHSMSNIESSTNESEGNDKVLNISNAFLLDPMKCDKWHNVYDSQRIITLADSFESDFWPTCESINDSDKIDLNETKEKTDINQKSYQFNEASFEGEFLIESVETDVTNDGFIEVRENEFINMSKSEKHEAEFGSTHSPRNYEINQEYQLNVSNENESTSHQRSSLVEEKENYEECVSNHGLHPDSGNCCKAYGIVNTILKYSSCQYPLNDSTTSETFLGPENSTKFSNSPCNEDESNTAHCVSLANRCSFEISEDCNVLKVKCSNSEATEADPLSATRNNKRKHEKLNDSDDCNMYLKSIKMEREKVFFHPVLEHHFWCIWRLNEWYPNEISSPKKGWEVFLDAMDKKVQKEETERKWNEFSEILNCISTLYKL